MLDVIEKIQNPQKTVTHSIIWCHGLGADAHDFLPIVPDLKLSEQNNIRFIFPNAPVRPITIFGGQSTTAWYDILSPERINAQEDEAGLIASQKEIETLIEQEIQRGIPSEKIFLAGFSQGCAISLLTLTRTKYKLAGIIGLSGYLPLLNSTPKESVNLDTPIFMAHGTLDPVVNIELADISYQHLQSLGYTVSWHAYPMVHSVCLEEIEDIGNFINQYAK
ncbi:alpha/beta hydrolase [Basilea psittacipulmonis]|uniref:Carboxylesterase n=1 Tax=Basilea psittacipulmonis DSM 24701 TaxID=1072685 RepID=A0A077DFM2_9BURK|nr:carboxylesterase [Basilea psittacipulmonis]AIL32976.1 carboxylesterase [Basilea psittacipulmonis DSM 24701]